MEKDHCSMGCCHQEADEKAHLDNRVEQEKCLQDGCLDEELKTIEEQLFRAEQQRDEYLLMAQRAQADFENFKKRNRAAISDAYQTATLETVEQFLPALDNLERALDSSSNSDLPQVQAVYKGVEMVIKQFKDILAKLGVEEIEALDKPFDPTYHHAVMQAEAENEDQENIVVEVLLKGYKHKDKVVRCSMVKVAN